MKSKTYEEMQDKISKLERKVDDLRLTRANLLDSNKELSLANTDLEKQVEEQKDKMNTYLSGKRAKEVNKTKKWLNGYYGETYGKEGKL